MKQMRAKQERVLEAVRHDFEGDAAIEFIRESGFAIDSAGIARILRRLGGRARVQEMMAEGQSNIEILEGCFPQEDFSALQSAMPPSQPDLFSTEASGGHLESFPGLAEEEFETTKMTLRVPSDLFEAIRLAARAEGKSRSDLIIEILTTALSHLPAPPLEDEE
jgi:hypothetical protein